MSEKISRRRMLGMTAGAAATALTGSEWVFEAGSDGRIVKAAKKSEGDWSPVFLSKKEVQQLATVCEAIIPRTDTPGARDARVHEYIDLALSFETEARRDGFREGLKWLDKHTKRTTGKSLQKASSEDVAHALAPLSDEHSSHPEELKPGTSFFRDVKTRTIFGYYTSVEGRVGELGLPEEVTMVGFEGCTHAPETHD